MGSALDYKYQVALSFSGKDREIARSLASALQAKGISVFYDEFAKADLWGKNLFSHLHEIYSSSARFCIPLLSVNFLENKWTKHELASAQEKSLDTTEEYILPIRLDETKIPGLYSSIAYIDYKKSTTQEIAELVSKKIQATKASNILEEIKGIIVDKPPDKFPDKVDGFIRNITSRDIRISNNEITSSLEDVWIYNNNRVRYNFAHDLGRYLRFKFKFYCGAVYTAWRVKNKLILSTLPTIGGFESGKTQISYEFEIYGSDRRKLALVAEWQPIEKVWGPIPTDEFHKTMKGKIADRSGCNMTRESIVYCLREKGANFSFPVGPDYVRPDSFCEWLDGDVESVLFDWDRNPRLVDPGIGVWTDLYHEETGEGILLFVIHGSWSNSALYALEDVLETYLPSRHIRTPLQNGSMRICIHLSNTPPSAINWKSLETYKFDDSNVWNCMERVYLAVARMIAAQRQVPVDPPKANLRLKELNNFHFYSFEEAVSSLKNAECPAKIKDYEHDNKTLGWSVLRHSPYSGRIGVENRIPTFNFGTIVTRQELIDYIQTNETEI